MIQKTNPNQYNSLYIHTNLNGSPEKLTDANNDMSENTAISSGVNIFRKLNNNRAKPQMS
jgi:hypothetical protein